MHPWVVLGCILVGVWVVGAQQQLTNLDDMHLRLVAVKQPPYVFFDDTLTGNARYSGFAVDLWLDVLKRAGRNITYEIYQPPDGSFGAHTSTGWTGALGELVNNRADIILAPLVITKERLEAMDVTVGFVKVGLRVMIPKPTTETDSLSFLQPFSGRLWLALIATAIGMALIMYAIDAMSPYGFRRAAEDDDKHMLNIPNSMFSSFASFIGIGGNSFETPRSWSNRIMVLAYFFFVLIVTSSYTANLTAFLTIKRINNHIAGIDDIRVNRLKFGVVANSAISQFFLHTPIVDYSVMQKQMVQYPTLDEAMEALRLEKIPAFVHASEIVDYVANQPPCNTLQVGELFNTGFYGIPVQKGSALRESLSDALLAAMEDGTVDTLHDKWYIKMGSCTGDSDISADVLDIPNLGGLFVVLFVFIGIAIGIMVFENFVYRKRKFPIFRQINRFCHSGDIGDDDGKAEGKNPFEDEVDRKRNSLYVPFKNDFKNSEL